MPNAIFFKLEKRLFPQGENWWHSSQSSWNELFKISRRYFGNANTKTIQNTDPVITPTISNIPIFSQTSIADNTSKRKADQLRNGESLREIFLNDRGLPPDSFIEKIPPPPDSSKLLGKNYYNIPGRG